MDGNLFRSQDGKEVLNIIKAIDELDLNIVKNSSVFDNSVHINQIKQHHYVVKDYHTSASFTRAFNKALDIINI